MALAIIAEHPVFGVGIDGYRYNNWQHLPLYAEWSRYPHNTWLMLGVSGGLGLALVAMAAAARLCWQRHDITTLTPAPGNEIRPWQHITAYALPALVAMTIIVIFGGFGSDNFDAFSNNSFITGLLAIILAAFAIAAALPVTLVKAARNITESTTTNSLWIVRAALIAWLVSASIDFPHQTPGAMTILAALAALLIPENKARDSTNANAKDQLTPKKIYGQLAGVLFLGCCGFFAMSRAQNLYQADEFLNAARAEQRKILLQFSQQPTGPEAEASIRQVTAHMLGTAQQWPVASEQILKLSSFLIDPRQRLAVLQQHPWPTNHAWWSAAAAAQAGSIDLAISFQQKSL